MPTKETIFKTLNQTRISPAPTTPTLFPELYSHETDTPGWMYSDLHNLFGEETFPTQPSFSAHIWQNFVMPLPAKSKRGFPQLTTPTIDFYNQHITTIKHAYQLGTHPYKNAKDFKLSQYACWCMSRNNPDMIFSRTYFIAPTIISNPDFETLKALCYQFARPDLRIKLSKYEKTINAIAHKNKIDFNEFRRVNRTALFGDHSKSHIAEQNDFYISPNTPLADHMGAATLYERANALERAIKRINQTHPITKNKILEIIFSELNFARDNMIKKQNKYPERDIFPISAPQVQSQLMRTERDFINKYAHQKSK